ncbi:MAG: hypothetical protein U7M05_12475 [Candidatus Igneacidithiobacillus chanchocoensis]
MQNHQPITITIGGRLDDALPAAAEFPADAFASIPVEFDTAGGAASFVVGLDRDGIIRRVVSQSPSERPVVAALVGTWVAAGLRVQHIEGFSALAKLVRKAASAEKDAAEPSTETQAKPATAPSVSPPADIAEDFDY